MKKKIFKLLSALYPGMIIKLSIDRISNPRIRKLRPYELEMIKNAVKRTVQYKEFDIQTYKWGKGEKKVLLIHGWEGQAGNFSDLIPKLLEQNYTVYSFDALSHGFSEKGKNSFFEFIDLVGEMIKTFKVDKLVSHSYGGVATTFTLFDNPELYVERYVLLTVPDKFMQRIEDISQQVGMSTKVKDRLVEELEKNLPWAASSANVSDKVKKINVNKALIIHDKDDKVIPIFQSKNVYENWEQCDFKEIEGTGHFRMLRTEDVLEDVVEFLER